MGTWDSGNFDNDTALDFLGNITDEIAKELYDPEGVEDIDLIMAAVSTYSALLAECPVHVPDPESLVKLRDSVLRVYDAKIDELEPKGDYKADKRRIIEETFSTLLARLNKG